METNDFIKDCGKSKPTILWKVKWSIKFECYSSDFHQWACKTEEKDSIWVLALFLLSQLFMLQIFHGS